MRTDEMTNLYVARCGCFPPDSLRRTRDEIHLKKLHEWLVYYYRYVEHHGIRIHSYGVRIR